MRNILKFIVAATTMCTLALGASAQTMEDQIGALNADLAGNGSDVRIGVVEYITAGESGELGRTVFFSDHGNKQLGHDFVPGDPRRGGGTNITVLVDDIDVTTFAHPGNILLPGEDLAAYHSVNDTWDGVKCANIPVTDLGDSGFDIGFVQFIVGAVPGTYGGEPVFLRADVIHGGMLTPLFFDDIACGVPGSGCGANILGATFTFVWIGPTDIDNNRKDDTAFREIYYNEFFPWANHPNDVTFDGLIDLESVALHEMGHGLSQGHFGEGFFQDRNRDGIVPNAPNEVITVPSASMNAAHTVAHRTVTGTDKGGHCSNWGSWPNN